MGYLAWRVLVGLHYTIHLHFMAASHIRCSVDSCFGHLKRKHRRSDTFTLQQLCEVVNNSATCNSAELAESDKMPWYDWDAYLLQLFKPLEGISKCAHSTFCKVSPGIVQVKESVSGEQQEINLRKAHIDLTTFSATFLLPITAPGGPSTERSRYLFTHIHEHVAPLFQDTLCPEPADN